MSGSRSHRFTAIGLAVGFVVCAVGAVALGLYVRGAVQRSAEQTDRRLRTLAWATLAYAAEHDGNFPTSEEALVAYGIGPAELPLGPMPVGGAVWPLRRSDALHGADPASLEDSLRAIIVTWSADPRVPPRLKPDGLPTSKGADDATGWLTAFAAASSRSPADVENDSTATGASPPR